jgi:hypothetical protein
MRIHQCSLLLASILSKIHQSLSLQIIRRANEIGEDPLSLSSRFCEEYLVDMTDLQCLIPTHQPRVTDHVEQIKDMITQVPPLLCLLCC